MGKRRTRTKSPGQSTNHGSNYNNGRGRRRRRVVQGDRVQGDRVAAVDREPVDDADGQLEEGMGLLEMHPNGYGFLRSPTNNYSRERTDPFVPGSMIEKYRLRQGVMIRGMVQQPRRQQGPRLREILDVDGMPPDDYLNVKTFDSLTPINPEVWYRLETGPEPLTTRVMDLLTPLGRGQRALIVAPPRTGKTILLQHISNGISTNYPEVKLIVLLIDERPEEVTDMRRNVNGEVVASSLDRDVESHVRLSQLIVERCKRLAEMGRDVFLLMDSITRLARAFNKWVGNTGRTMSGGVDIKAMDIPKKLFATARAVRGRRVADDRRHRADRHRQPHGRIDFPGVQGHGQHGTGAGPQAGGPPRLAGHGHHPVRNPPGRVVARPGNAARRDDVAPDFDQHESRRSHGTACPPIGPFPQQRRVPAAD